MRTNAVHETYPGHHVAVSLSQENESLPFFRRVATGFSAFSEGWALYAERLAQESHFFATEADQSEGFDLLGMLAAELLHSARLVVDTGIHHFDWTRDQAINYMTQHTALSADDVLAEVERSSVCPGHAVVYMIGQLEFLDLRTFVQEQKGEDFCLKAFHSLLLGGGVMSLQQLKKRVHDYCKVEPAAPEAAAQPPADVPVHVVVQEKVDHVREELLRKQQEEADQLHNQYPDLHKALRDNGFVGQMNHGMQYMDYVVGFVSRGITTAEQLKDVEPHVLVEIGLTPMEQRLYKKLFSMKK
jgi:hypothetical protein